MKARFRIWLVVVTASVALALSDLTVWSGRDLLAAVTILLTTAWLVEGRQATQ